MLSWILLILVLAALVAVGTWMWGTVFGRGEVLPPIGDAAVVREANRQANRQAVADGDLGAVTFELVPRGYRPEQVDDVIAHLAWELAKARRELAGRPAAEKD